MPFTRAVPSHAGDIAALPHWSISGNDYFAIDVFGGLKLMCSLGC